MPKTALITGVTGQDGAYLSKFLLSKNYIVHGLQRRSSLSNTGRIEQQTQDGLILHYGDMTDGTNIIRLVNEIQPDEIYNLAAQSHVHVSFDTPEYTGNVDGLGTLRLLEAIRILGLEKKTRFFQASTSELFGQAVVSPQNEKTPFYPRSPYAIAKLYAYWMTINYREAYSIHASNGILFNHESPLRGEEFVTRKITLAAARISKGLQNCLYLGNLDAKRDWSHAEDIINGVYQIIQHDTPDDFILASGQTHTVREFATLAFKEAGINIEWQGTGVDEIGFNSKNGQKIIEIDKKYFRPTEVEHLLGDVKKAKTILGWEPKIGLNELIAEMVQEDLKKV